MTITPTTDIYRGPNDPEMPAYYANGGDWEELIEAARANGDETMVINFGPHHPSTHGVLRLIIELDGETVTSMRPSIGYLHTGIEKNMEYKSWTQGVAYCTRMDYCAPLFTEMAYCMAVEKLLGIEDKIPQRAQDIRVLMMELNRIASHLIAIGTGGLELGAYTPATIGFRDRDIILDFFEATTGLRMNHEYFRPGGVAVDLADNGLDQLREVIAWQHKNLPDYARTRSSRHVYLALPSWISRLAWRSVSQARHCEQLGFRTICVNHSHTRATKPTISRSAPGILTTLTGVSGYVWQRCSSRSRSLSSATNGSRNQSASRS